MNTPKKHKHYDAIVAWAEGRPVQYKPHSTEEWALVSASMMPTFSEAYEYRVKPETVKWRLYLYKQSLGHLTVGVITNQVGERELEKLFHFVRWLGDWQETEV